jgi:hypothetical protein
MNGFGDLKNKGIDSDRLNIWNPREISFAHIWEEENEKHNILGCLLSGWPAGVIARPTEEEKIVAASVIQWLGTNVGQAFLQSCEIDIANRTEQFKTAQRASRRLDERPVTGVEQNGTSKF